MEQHAAAVLAYALRRCSSREDAEDVRQKTFEVAWRRLDDVPAGEAALPWLYAVARYVLANEQRGARRRDQLRVRLTQATPRHAGEPQTRDEIRAVLAAISRLSRQHQEILLLSAWEGLSHAEIAVVLGISERASALRLHRARRRLEEIVAKEGEDRRTQRRRADSAAVREEPL